jgi:hypothetical protein
VTVAQFLFTIKQQLHEAAVDIAEAEEAEIVCVNWQSLTG